MITLASASLFWRRCLSRWTVFLFIILFSYCLPRDVTAADFEVIRIGGAALGPKLMIVAGIHGNEFSGPEAARKFMSGPPPECGVIVAVPVACPEALTVKKRLAPGWYDLNRAFPRPAGGGEIAAQFPSDDPAVKRARSLLLLIAAESPDLLLDLHESDRFWTEGPGPSLVIPRNSNVADIALQILEMPELRGFSFTGPPPAGSLAAAVNGILGIPALIVEAPGSLATDARMAIHLQVIRAAWTILKQRK